jgi:uncharacterized protein YndB with AHSA1/START domain
MAPSTATHSTKGRKGKAAVASQAPLTISVTINAPASKVWDALTRNDKRRQWFFGVDTRTDWKEGSALTHTGEYEGKPYSDKGEILEIEPGRMLVHTHWSDLSGLPDKPENYQTVTFMLQEADGKTTLTVAESNHPNDKARETSEGAWQKALEGLKHLVEA